jgi:peptidyl-prolyl cis-trans isomerase C
VKEKLKGGYMIVRLIGLTVAILLLQAGNVYSEDLNPVVGKVGDFVLREADLDRMIGYQPAEAQKSIQSSSDQRTNFIRQILLTKAIASRARKDGFEKKPETREIITFLIDQYLAQEYLSKVVVANVTLTDEEMKKYYAEHEGDFLIPGTVKVRHIFISAPKDSTAELKDKAKAKAEDLLRQIRKGEDFGKIAREYSEDSDSAAKDGDLGYIAAGKTNSQEFENAAFALKPGEISNIVETPFGFHIIRSDERREKRTASFDETKEYIRAQLKEQNKQKKGQEFLDNIIKESGLEIVGEKSAISK